MKMLSTLILLCAACLFLSPATHAQCSPEERKQAAADAELHREELDILVRETARAVQLKNPSFFRRVYGDDFVGTFPNGTVMDRAALIAAIQNSPATYATFVATSVRTRIFENTAIVTSVWSARGTQDGRSFSRQSRVIQIYVYGQGGWRVVASQETLLPG
ncbi:MAG TPA: nuclear transport factor 2 family protein [Verrucomicrobiae bacterium]|nr:nuclear transport factor 2 family protein [Verrucomicrobiae bacterium]